jgi:hypothetical protein
MLPFYENKLIALLIISIDLPKIIFSRSLIAKNINSGTGQGQQQLISQSNRKLRKSHLNNLFQR